MKRKTYRLRKCAKKTKTPLNKNKLAELNTELGVKVKSGKQKIFTATLQSFMKSSPCKVWSLGNAKTKSHLESLSNDEANLAEMFNKYFLSLV